MVIYCVNSLIQYKKSLVKHLLTKKAGEGTMSLARIGLIVVFIGVTIIYNRNAIKFYSDNARVLLELSSSVNLLSSSGNHSMNVFASE